MKWLGPTGLLLATTLYVVHSMPTETTTTTRYTPLEGYNRFSLHTTPNSDQNMLLNLSASNVAPHFSSILLNLNNTIISRRIRTAKQPKDDSFYNEVLVSSLKANNFSSDLEEGRKLKRKPTKNQSLFTNFITTTFGDFGSSNKTVKINTVNKVSTKLNKPTNSATSKPITNLKLPEIKKNSSLVMNEVKKGIQVVTTKAPVRSKINKITRTTTRSPYKVTYKTTTSVPIVIKLTKKTKATTQRSAAKRTEKPITIKLTQTNLRSTTAKPKRKPTVHKIITKWSDSTDLSEVKQDWYEEGVPFPNPNPEVTSFSPPVSLSGISSISPLTNDLLGGLNDPYPNPEISSYSPPVSISDVGLIYPLVSDFPENLNYPNPNPEITSYSPPFSLGELSSISPLSDEFSDDSSFLNPAPEVSSYSPPYSISDVPPLPSETPEVEELPPSSPAEGNPISVFNLDMIPDSTNTKQAGGGSSGSPCPTVHISSSMLAPRQMECSDLNLVINSHFHQNQNGGGTRNPSIDTYDAAGDTPVDPVLGDAPLAGEGTALASPGVADPGVGNSGTLADGGVGGAPQAAVPQAAVPQAPAGGTGGTGGNGGDGDDGGGGLKLPDMKPLFDAIGYICSKLWQLFGFLRNPYFYIVPMAAFFALGFFTILALFPWWIPLLLLYLGVKSHKQPKDAVTFYKHVHKPVHHADGWFWNHQTKTWQNVQDFHHKRNDHGDKRVDNIEDAINRLKIKYEGNMPNGQSGRRRKRPK